MTELEKELAEWKGLARKWDRRCVELEGQVAVLERHIEEGKVMCAIGVDWEDRYRKVVGDLEAARFVSERRLDRIGVLEADLEGARSRVRELEDSCKQWKSGYYAWRARCCGLCDEMGVEKMPKVEW